MNWLASVMRSFGPALAGLVWALKTQRNLQAHALTTVVVLPLGFCLGISAAEWCAVVLAAGLVWCAELMNTAVEVLADRVSKDREEPIRRLKDVAAAAVLMAAAVAFSVGVIVFLPKLWRHF